MAIPRVAVLLSFYNDERFLAAAIESILCQTYADFELILVNDASTDRSREIAAAFNDSRIRLVDNETNVGLARSLNRGLSMVRSEYVARMDGDDLSFPSRLARQVEYLDSHHDVAVVGTQATIIDSRGRRIRVKEWWNPQFRKPATELGMEWHRVFFTPLLHASTMYRHAIIWNDLGGYDARYSMEDAELWARVGKAHHLANVDERLVAIRYNPFSLSNDLARFERHSYAEQKTPIIHALLREVLHWEDVPIELASRWVQINNPVGQVSALEIRRLRLGLDACAAHFLSIHPASAKAPEVRRYQAAMLVQLLWKACSVDRMLALSIFASTLRRHCPTALRILAPFAVLFLFGERSLRAWRFLRRRERVKRQT
jgi:glycosyltransferase involved in cell wall biosynthesis